MQFIDEASIDVAAGNGGDGCVSFLRERNRPKGGPDGGNGGRGGDVYLRVEPGLNTLVDYRFKRHFRAANGRHGEGGQKTGRCGEDQYLPVPIGTKVSNAENGLLLGELITTNSSLLVARGGDAGRGNMTYASSTNRTPYRHTKGEQGEQLRIRLELQLLADIGLLGMPNAGKSSLIHKLSAARPKVADYPFTTLTPQLGLVRRQGSEAVIADIPGLIAGSAQGRGLGSRFLRHVNRTSLLWHVVDVCPDDSPLAHYRIIRDEIRQSELPGLADKPCWLVLNKIDLLENDRIEQLRQTFRAELGESIPIHAISAMTGEGCEQLALAALEHIRNAASEAQEA